MIKIGIRNKLLVPREVIYKFPEILDKLTLANPSYNNIKKYGSPEKQRMLNFIAANLYFYEKKGDNYLLPVGVWGNIKKLLRENNIEYKVKDQRRNEPIHNWAFTDDITLDPIQEESVAKVLKYNGGVICIPTAAGKTIVGTKIMAETGLQTLVTVPTKILLKQWRSRIQNFLGIEAGILGDSKKLIKPITIGIVNTVVKVLPEIWNEFGMVIVDEHHYSGSPTYKKILMTLNPLIRLGLTATPIRSDGLEPTLYFYCGPKIIEKDYEDVKNRIVYPEINVIPTDFDIPKEQMPYKEAAILKKDKDKNDEDEKRYVIISSQILNMMVKDEDRNKLLCKIIDSDKNGGRTVLVCSDRKSHLDALYKGLTNQKDAYILTSDIPSGEVDEIIELANNKSIIILATYSLVEVGMDIPKLNSLVFATPRANVKQIIGRVIRKDGTDIIPRINDPVDELFLSRNSYYKRVKVYKKFYPDRSFRLKRR